jgi:hypothetical protein
LLWDSPTASEYTIAALIMARSYKVLPLPEMDGGIGIVEMLFKSNIIALVGGGSKPAFPPTQFVLWDDHQKKSIGSIDFKSNIKAVRLRKD